MNRSENIQRLRQETFDLCIIADGASGPEFFSDTVEMFNTLRRPEQVRVVKGAWVQDMAQADWELPRGHWTDARSAFYVRGSRRHGSMGPTLASFAQHLSLQSNDLMITRTACEPPAVAKARAFSAAQLC